MPLLLGGAILSRFTDCRSEPPPVWVINVYWIAPCFSSQKGQCRITEKQGLRLVSPPALLLQSTFWLSPFPKEVEFFFPCMNPFSVFASAALSLRKHLPFIFLPCCFVDSPLLQVVLVSTSELSWLFSLHLPWHFVLLWRILSIARVFAWASASRHRTHTLTHTLASS